MLVRGKSQGTEESRNNWSRRGNARNTVLRQEGKGINSDRKVK